MELVLSFMFFARSYIPLHRSSPGTDSAFAWARSPAEALAFSYTWNECATQFAIIFGQAVSLCGQKVIPAHVSRARICSLYRQGAGTCVFGFSHRPAFPHQAQVASVLQAEFHKRIRPCSYSWWPTLDLNPDEGSYRLHWQAPHATWNVY